MALNFEKMGGILPAVIQDDATGDLLMLGFMNREAYDRTRKEGRVCFYSRTRERLWTKGEESGNYLYVKEIRQDCDQDALLIRVDPEGPVCHTGRRSCFEGNDRILQHAEAAPDRETRKGTRPAGEDPGRTGRDSETPGKKPGTPGKEPGTSEGEPGFLDRLEDLLRSRKEELPENSYTAKLFKSGVNKIAQKLGEEAVELVIEAKEKDDRRFLNEAADLLFHLLILLVERGYRLEDVVKILEERH